MLAAHCIENHGQRNGRGVSWLTSCKIGRSGGVESPIELSWIYNLSKSLEGHWLTHLAFCLGFAKVPVTQSFHPLSSKSKFKKEKKEEEALEGHLGEFCARKSFLVTKPLCSYLKTSFYFNSILKCNAINASFTLARCSRWRC